MAIIGYTPIGIKGINWATQRVAPTIIELWAQNDAGVTGGNGRGGSRTAPYVLDLPFTGCSRAKPLFLSLRRATLAPRIS